MGFRFVCRYEHHNPKVQRRLHQVNHGGWQAYVLKGNPELAAGNWQPADGGSLPS